MESENALEVRINYHAKSYNQMVYSHLVDGIARYSGKPLQQVYTGYDSQCRELTSITVLY